MTDNIGNALMFNVLKEIRAELREQRSELREHRGMLLNLAEAIRRAERRINELPAEVELMLRSEMLGRLTHFETQLDERLAQLADRIHAPETSGRS